MNPPTVIQYTPDQGLRSRAVDWLKGKEVLVTGATGKVGVNVVRFLASNGISVLASGLNESKRVIFEGLDNVAYFPGDITEESYLRSLLERAEVLIHLAALTDPFACQENPSLAEKQNVEPARFITESSPDLELAILASGFMASTYRVGDDRSVYGRTKSEAEELWLSGGDSEDSESPRYVVARWGSVAEQNGELGIVEYFKEAARGGEIIIFDEEAERKVAHIDQIIDLLCFIISEGHRCPSGSIASRTDFPRINIFGIAHELVEDLVRQGKKRPKISIVGINPAVRVKDVVLSSIEEERAVVYSNFIVVPPEWVELPEEVHLSFPLRGEKAVQFVNKIPWVDALNHLRGVKPDNRVGDFPHTLEICPTSACNFGCVQCSYTDRNDSLKATLDKDFVFKILGGISTKLRQNSQDSEIDLARVKEKFGVYPIPGIFIAGWGEPLVVPWIRELILRAGDDFPVGLCTNGSFLDKMGILAPEVLGKIRLLLWSVYASDEMSFRHSAMGRRPKGKNFFSETDEGIREALRIREKHGLPMKLAIKILLNRENYELVWQMYDYVSGFNPDRLVVRLANNFEEGEEVELTTFERHKLRRIILENGSRKHFHPLKRFARIFLDPETQLKYEPEWADHCYNLLNGQFAMIDPDGEVYCSVTIDGKPEFSIGNINEISWEELWGGEKHRQQVADGEKLYGERACFNACGNCRHNGANLAMQRYLQLDSQQRGRLNLDYYLQNDGPFI